MAKKIVCISDTHNEHNQLIVPDGDILIHAGDIANGSLRSLEDFNTWLGTLPHKYKIVIAGNHDEYAYYNPLEIKSLLNNCIYLENEGCTVEQLRIWGSPISPRFGHWWFMADRGDEITRYWKLIPSDIDILITHAPPSGILDVTCRNENVGCYDLCRKVCDIHPKFHVFGHIHESYGTEKLGNTTFINASIMNDDYDLVHKPIVIEL